MEQPDRATIKERHAQWVAALRSGKYEQGQNYLKISDGGTVSHCCLGVACELVPGVKQREGENEISILFEDSVGHTSASSLPKGAQDYYGLNSAFGDVENPKCLEQTKLTAMNDIEVPFEEIADFIENNFDRLVKEEYRE